jgi:hypoxanthine phosphoribosyltransferase
MDDQTVEQMMALRAGAECLISPAQIDLAYEKMAVQISDRLGECNPLFLVVLTGGMVPAGKLLSRLDFPLMLDYIHATRYQGKTQGGKLEIRVQPVHSLKDRVVVIVDDILDEGDTLAGVIDFCRERQAREIYSAVLVDKQHDRRLAGVKADFFGVEIPDRYVFGEGMDYQEYFRNLNGIFALRPDSQS